VTGCHNTHRVTALKQVGGFAPHDADDLLITLIYRSRKWRGVYVPRILARGLTPVDWAGYIQQQLRWARSVLDIKLRKYRQIAGKLSVKERIISFLHGLYYLQGTTVIISLLLVAYMLAAGLAPRALNYPILVPFGLMLAALVLCHFYRQRFYLDPRNEWGWHWRAGALQLAKWPYLLLALSQVLLNRRLPYVLTSKVKGEPRPNLLLWPHRLVAALICTAWVGGIMSGRALHPLLHLSAFTTVIGNLVLIATEHMSFPEPYDPSLRPSSRQVETPSYNQVRKRRPGMQRVTGDR
jgi:Glycosyl transferase family group 2